jgi:hypothetical protein
MKWFKHDSNATQDAKIKKLIIRYGATGYAIYFHCLELIAGNVSETNLTFELEHDSEIIADNLRIQGSHDRSGINLVEEIMRFIVEIGLFEQSGDKIFCFKLLKRLDASMASDGFRRMIAKAKESHDIVMIESCPSHDNIMLDYTILDKTTKEKKRKEKEAPQASPHTPEKLPHGEFGNIKLTDQEYRKLTDRYKKQDVDRVLETMGAWMKSKGKVYKDHYAALLNWIKKDGVQERGQVYRAPDPEADEGLASPEEIAEVLARLPIKRFA